jgi:hypothetical protein
MHIAKSFVFLDFWDPLWAPPHDSPKNVTLRIRFVVEMTLLEQPTKSGNPASRAPRSLWEAPRSLWEASGNLWEPLGAIGKPLGAIGGLWEPPGAPGSFWKPLSVQIVPGTRF